MLNDNIFTEVKLSLKLWKLIVKGYRKIKQFQLNRQQFYYFITCKQKKLSASHRDFQSIRGSCCIGIKAIKVNFKVFWKILHLFLIVLHCHYNKTNSKRSGTLILIKKGKLFMKTVKTKSEVSWLMKFKT